jgi:hypothetical protein
VLTRVSPWDQSTAPNAGLVSFWSSKQELKAVASFNAFFRLVLDRLKTPLDPPPYALRKGEKKRGGLKVRPEFSPGLSGTALAASRAKPWVLVAPKRRRPEGPQERSIPHVVFVVVDFVTFQEHSELILKTQTFMMLGLGLDVFSDLTHR